jgi:hypothetical protein
MVPAEWWKKELDILERIVADTEFYTMEFDKSGAIVDALRYLAENQVPDTRCQDPFGSQH